ncbi:MAG TPA: co-chaperone YbbN [Alphaproteobacteria bacterium]|nr:co-chaperone YbbN [Alphaproteobacteria bacterium]
MQSIVNEQGVAAGGAEAGLIKDTSTATFMADVIDASRTVPVIVDLWAPWCGPCRQLGPLLEKVVREAKGKLRLVKVNIDENPQIAQQFRVQSIPAVFAVAEGRVVDGFVGALPESQVRAFAQRLMAAGGGEADDQIGEAVAQAKQLLDAGDVGTASALFGQILQHEPENLSAMAGLARCHVMAGDVGQAKKILDGIPAEKADDAEIAAARSALELAEQASKSGPLDELRAKVAAQAGDLQARFDLANALFAAGQQEEAVEQLLEIVKRNRAWNEEAARKQLVKLFEALGPTHPLTATGRRRLSSLLFA